jgi:TRAP-type C4-dicarboxylate transport system permease large subunit
MMEVLGMIILIVPIFFPLVVALGFDPIWFGILTVRAVEIGQITPPVGINVFVIKAVSGDVPLESIYKGIIPFFFGDLCLLALLVAFPQISLFLPGLMKG